MLIRLLASLMTSRRGFDIARCAAPAFQRLFRSRAVHRLRLLLSTFGAHASLVRERALRAIVLPGLVRSDVRGWPRTALFLPNSARARARLDCFCGGQAIA